MRFSFAEARPGKQKEADVGEENRLSELLSLLGDLVCLNLLWLLCSLPLITIGAASAAAYAVAIRLARREDVPIARTFFHQLRQSFGQATLLWLLTLVVFAVGAFDLYYAFALCKSDAGIAFAVVGVVVLLLAAVGCAFAWPLEGRYRNTLAGTLKNAFALARLYPKTMLLIVAVWVAPIGICLYWPELLVSLGWLWVLLGFGLLFYAGARLCEPVFQEITLKTPATGEIAKEDAV